MPGGDDDRHRREEKERRAKRKASRGSKSEAQLEKERKQREYREKILKKHGGAKPPSGGSGSKRPKPPSGKKPPEALLNKSAFQGLFQQRAQGFQIDFRFRNAPPRPPVGPTFVGNTLEQVLHDECRQYKPLNAVEVNYVWKLHSEADLGVPLAPSAMDVVSYSIESEKQLQSNGNNNKSNKKQQQQQQHQKDADDMDIDDEEEEQSEIKLDPADEALLDWKGSMGDTAADDLKRRQERKRAQARLAMAGKPSQSPAAASSQKQQQQSSSKTSKKAFSRVLNEGMQTWMKKTTYLSNDYTRKVHDFKSLAQTKQELAVDLQAKQDELAKKRSTQAVIDSFEDVPLNKLKHPMRKNLKPKKVVPLLPSIENWGKAFTHVVIDKPPIPRKNQTYDMAGLNKAVVGNVEKRQANARMSCQLFVPSSSAAGSNNNKDDDKKNSTGRYEGLQAFDLDVVPLKEDEDAPHAHFVLWVDPEKGVATYLPISSRVQLSSGRPVGGSPPIRYVKRRKLSQKEQDEAEEGMAEIDKDMAEKHHLDAPSPNNKRRKTDAEESHIQIGARKKSAAAGDGNDDDDGEDDFGDDDDSSDSGDDEALFGTSAKAVAAEG